MRRRRLFPPCRSAVDWTFTSSCKLLYFPAKLQDMAIKVFLCLPGSALPKVPSSKAENIAELFAKFDGALKAFECIGESGCTLRDIMNAPGKMSLEGLVQPGGVGPAKGSVAVRALTGWARKGVDFCVSPLDDREIALASATTQTVSRCHPFYAHHHRRTCAVVWRRAR